MAALLRVFPVSLWLLLLCEAETYAHLPPKCKLPVEKTTYSITNWDWKIVTSSKVYYINLCTEITHPASCSSSSVCSTSLDNRLGETLGNLKGRVFNSTAGAAGFSIGYTGGKCEEMSSSSKRWETRIFMRCGKFLGSPQFVDLSVSNEKCVAMFEFVTKEVCKQAHTEPEIPCSLYGSDNKLRDLSPLIKLKGGYEVVTSIPGFDFVINVCRGISADPNGPSSGCPKNSSMCRIKKNLHVAEDIGNINFASRLSFSNEDIILSYNATTTVDNCKENSMSKITFRCPKESVDKGPVLTVAQNCFFEVLWETDFACAQHTILSTNTCMLQNQFVNFNLSKLTAAKLDNYKVRYSEKEKDGTETHYIIYMNVCKSIGFSCGTGGTNSTACQEKTAGNVRKSLGDIGNQTLRYADRQLTLIYHHGDSCSSGLHRTTIIMFNCNPSVGKGQPVFSFESYCFYYFVWETKYACPPSRRTGTGCRVESPTGVRYDLSALVRIGKERNWMAVDGESSSSDETIAINVCGQLTPQNETEGCDRASAICMINRRTGIVANLGRYNSTPTLNQDNSIKLLYKEGSECKRDNLGNIVKRQSTITFVCQPGDLESPPVLVARTEDDCQFEFIWKSAVACSLGVNTGKDCKVQDSDAGYVFDLTPLARRTRSGKHFFSLVNQSRYTYELTICGGSNNTSCGGTNVGACQVERRDPTKHYLIGQASSKLYYYDGMLNLTYANGQQCHNGVNRTTYITFLCNETAADEGVGEPKFDFENHCVYHFRWFTKYACPATVAECFVRSASDQYDLTSLVKTKDNWQAQGVGGKFYINVCRSLNLESLASGCLGTSAICLKKEDGSTLNLGSVKEAPRMEGQHVTITYANGDACNGKKDKFYRTKITFICKTGLTSSSPKFEGTEDDGCLYKFNWETAAACKIGNVVGHNCAVRDPNSDTNFNLLALKKQEGKAMYTGNLTANEEQGTFELNICGPVKECRKGVKNTGACLTKSNGDKIVLGLVSTRVEYKGEIVTLVYREGDNFVKTGQQREVHIKFFCNPRKPFGSPEFTKREGNRYVFEYQTSLVCAASAVQCSVTGKGNKVYDLTPLGLTSGNWEAVDPKAKDKHLHYFINVCRPVNPGQQVIRCPGGAIGACQVDHGRKKGYNLGYVQSNPQIADNGDLTLQYSGGSACHQQFNKSVRIMFSCSEKMGSPIFLSKSPFCEYVFLWETPSACALTRETGNNCTVFDKQYGYMFNLSKLYKESGDYNVSVAGAPGVTIILNACKKLVSKTACKGSHRGACIMKADGKGDEPVALNNSVTYFNGQINMTYGATSKTSINFIFECDQSITGRETGPSCEKKSDKQLYECRWPTGYACRPMVTVQCSIGDDDGVTNNQYDFLPLSMSVRNWEARITTPNFDDVSYFINVCRAVVSTKNDAASSCPPTAGVCMVKKGQGYNLGKVRHGPQKNGSNIFLIYEDGDFCDGGVKYSSRIQMQCGSTEGEPIFVKKTQCQYEFLWITSTACSVNAQKEVVSDNCTVTNPQTRVQFDLTPLRNSEKNYMVHDGENRTYYLNLCGPLISPPKLCPPNSGVCQVGKDTVNAGMANSLLHFDDGVLFLNLSGGDDCHHVKKKRETIISFVCSSGYGEQHLGKPVFISENDCVYYIIWHTPLVCESQYECAAVTNDGDSKVKYSLGRLSRSDANWVVTKEGDNDDKARFYLNLCRPLVPMPGINCPAGSWACRIEDPQTPQNLGRATDPPVVVGEEEVRLVYKSKIHCLIDRELQENQFMETHFTFICAYGSLGHPVLERTEKCVYYIRWFTSAACPIEQRVVGDCKVYDNGTGEYYDLSPLSKAGNGTDIPYYKVPALKSNPPYFYLSLCHELSLSKAKNCTRAGVCKVPKVGEKKALGYFQNRDMTYYKDEGLLILKYCSASCDSKKRNLITSKIVFVCDRNQPTVGSGPQLIVDGKYGAEFTWKTSLVCPPSEEECSYSDGSKSYDLGLLSSRTRSWKYTHNKDRFWINICRGINDGPKGCPSTASVCMIRGNSKDKKVNVLGVTSTQMMSINDDHLQLTYSGMPPVEGCGQRNPKIVFYFQCGNHVGRPQFKREDWSSCSFVIQWKSSVACQVKRKTLQETDCVVKHPFTHRRIDFRKLVGKTGGTWKISGLDEKNAPVSYYINICDELKNPDVPQVCKGKHVCLNGMGLDTSPSSFYYEDEMFSLEMKSTNGKCSNKTLRPVIVIIFQCSVGEGVGTPKFDYLSSSCHHVFAWPTSIVCPADLSREVTDIPAAHQSLKSPAGRNVGIAFGVVFAVLLIAVLVFVLYKPSRRHSLISCLRWNFKRHILRKEIKFPVYRYQKLGVTDDDEVDSLIKEAEGSDDEEEHDDDDLLPF